jgi:hypothetical protein
MLAPATDMPWVRTAANVDPDPKLEELRQLSKRRDVDGYNEEMRQRLRTENLAAIATRLKGRPTA